MKVRNHSGLGFALKTHRCLWGRAPHCQAETLVLRNGPAEVIGFVSHAHAATARQPVRDGPPEHWAEILGSGRRVVNEIAKVVSPSRDRHGSTGKGGNPMVSAEGAGLPRVARAV
jgi:hypothetical protein